MATSDNQKLRGVNLGGWLVLEKWMYSEIFEGLKAENEHDLSQTEHGRTIIRNHHANFIGEDDFAWLHDNGLNAVRIPVGYWIFGENPPYVGSINYLDRAFVYAQKYGIKILICLHGAPGSQNGHHHSGAPQRSSGWFTDKRFRTQTLEALGRLIDRYASHPALWGIELLNEPKPGLIKLIILRKFYRRAFKLFSDKTRIIFSDSFMPRTMSGCLGKTAYMDVHWYHFAFIFEHITPLWFYYKLLINRRQKLLKRLKKKQPVLIGEWSIVLSTRTLRRYPKKIHESMMDEHGKLQLLAYAEADGWFYWSYKTTGRGTWNFKSLVEDGRLVLPITPDAST